MVSCGTDCQTFSSRNTVFLLLTVNFHPGVLPRLIIQVGDWMEEGKFGPNVQTSFSIKVVWFQVCLCTQPRDLNIKAVCAEYIIP